MTHYWYGPGEMKAEALAGQRQPEFDPPEREDDPVDTSNEAMEALLVRDAQIQAAIATQISAVRTEDDGYLLLEDGSNLELEG